MFSIQKKVVNCITIVCVLFSALLTGTYATEQDFNQAKPEIDKIRAVDPTLPTTAGEQKGSVGYILSRLFDNDGKISNWFLKVLGTRSDDAVLRWEGGNGGQFVQGSIFDDGTNVGIGKTPGTNKLEIEAISYSSNQDGGIALVNNNPSIPWTSGMFLRSNASGVPRLEIVGPNGSNGISIRDNENVGIGNANPGYKLDVSGDINFTGDVRKNGVVLDLAGKFQEGATSGEIFYSGGDVGIGKTNPGTKLDVNGTIRSTFMQVESSGSAGIKLNNTSTTDTDSYLVNYQDNFEIQSRTDANAYGATPMIISMQAPSNSIRVINSGNVGIGVSNPSERLHVGGHIKADSFRGFSHMSSNPNNTDANVSLDFLTNVARIRVGGIGGGAANGLDIQGPGNTSLLRVNGNGNVNIAGTLSVAGGIDGDTITDNTIDESEIEDSFVARDSQLLDGKDNTQFGREVLLTSNGTATDSGYWTKLADINVTGSYNGGSLILSLVSEETGNPNSAIITVSVRKNLSHPLEGGGISYFAKGGGTGLSDDSFKLVNNGDNQVVELWMRKDSTYHTYKVYELSRQIEGTTITYLSNQGWVATEPTGVNEKKSNGLKYGGNKVFHAGNDGIGSGIDADALDGVNGASYLRSDANDTVTGITQWQDGGQVRLGNSADMRIFHDGVNSHIQNYTGDFNIRSLNHGAKITVSGEDVAGTYRNMIVADPDDEVKLYYNGSEKLNTSNIGVTVTGTITASDPTTSNQLTTKNYVDTLVTAGVSWKAPVAVSASVTYGTCDAAKEGWATYNKSDDIVYLCNASAWISIGASASIPYATTTTAGRMQIAGDLQGTWNNITLKDGIVNSANIANNTITESDISDSYVARNSSLLDGTDSSDFFKKLSNIGAGDFNTFTDHGVYRVSDLNTGFTNGPTGVYAWGNLHVFKSGTDYMVQEYIAHNSPDRAWRTKWNGAWTAWNSNEDLYINVGSSGDQIQDNTIDSSEIENETITATDLAVNSVGNSELIDNPTISQLNITAGNGNGVRFWASDAYKISMSNAADYIYGPVTDYSIKTNMSANAGRGWTWGAPSVAPKTALEVTTGNFQTAGIVRAEGGLQIGPDSLFIRDAANRIATDDSFHVRAASPATYLYSTNTYLGNTSGDTTQLRGNNFTWNQGIIQGNGNVGIGTTAPISPLHISGGASMTAGYDRTLTISGVHPTMQFKGASDTNNSAFIGYDAQSTREGLRFWTGHSGDDNGGTDTAKMSITAAGNVGIGTPTPSGNLHVKDTVDNSTVLYVGGHANGATVNENSIGLTTWVDGNNYVDLKTTASGSRTVFRTGKGLESGATKLALTIDSENANIGIGTLAPTSTLDVAGSINGNSLLLRSGDNSDQTDSTQIRFGYSNTNTYMHSIRTRHNGSAKSGNAIDFWLWDQGVDPYTTLGSKRVMTLDGTGNIGIGTTTPSAKLHVEGIGRQYQISKSTSPDEFSGWIAENSTGQRAYIFASGNSAPTLPSSSDWSGTYSDHADGHLFRIGGSDRMAISSGGNIGIGTTTPDAKLEVVSSGPKTSARLDHTIFSSSESTTPMQLFVHQGGGVNTDARYFGLQAVESTVGGIDLALQADAGNVGIGTINPSTKLHVGGNIGATGWVGAGCESNCETGGGYAIMYANGNIANTGNTTTTGVVRGDGGLQIGPDALFIRDTANRIATDDSFYVRSVSPATYLYSTATYLGNVSGDTTHLRGNNFTWNQGIIQGNGSVGIGTTSISSGLKLDVTGKVGASEYCDENGNNCYDASVGPGGGLGVGQTWQNLTGSRSRNIWYQNTTGKPISVYVHTNTPDAYLYVNTSASSIGEVQIAGHDGASATWDNLHGIIPNGSYYKLAGAPHRYWAELR